jgi:hypothetical protein
LSDPVEVRRQVWHSLVSMLQVYAHAAGLNGKPFAVSCSEHSAQVRHEDASLTLSMSPETGAATWQIVRPGREEEGNFQIDEHGVLRFPVCPKELDTAAMDWMDMLAQPEHVKL